LIGANIPGFLVNNMGQNDRGPAIPGRHEFYYNYFWRVENFFEMAGMPIPLIALREASLPTMTVNKGTIKASSLEYKYAESITWEDVKFTWYDSDGLLPILRDWRRSVWDPETGLAMQDEYKKTTILEYYLPTGKKANQWKLVNSWPSQIRHGELTYSTSDVKLVEVTVTYDWAEERPA
jgi:hypothetical protein